MLHVRKINKESYYVVEGKLYAKEKIFFFSLHFQTEVENSEQHATVKLNLTAFFFSFLLVS